MAQAVCSTYGALTPRAGSCFSLLVSTLYLFIVLVQYFRICAFKKIFLHNDDLIKCCGFYLRIKKKIVGPPIACALRVTLIL